MHPTDPVTPLTQPFRGREAIGPGSAQCADSLGNNKQAHGRRIENSDRCTGKEAGPRTRVGYLQGGPVNAPSAPRAAESGGKNAFGACNLMRR